MTMIVEKKDLFSVDTKEYALAHCVSADYAMGAGIAVEFNKRYNAKRKCLIENPKPKVPDSVHITHNGTHIFNLVTKPYYWYKPSYCSVNDALVKMKAQIIELGITKLAMPTIASGLDGLYWPKVKLHIEMVFEDMEDLEILVCEKR